MSNDLKPCPFCGCEMHFESNRDWHRVDGAHLPDCVFSDVEDVALMVPATKDGKEWAAVAWNRRATPSTANGAVGEMPELPPFNVTYADHSYPAYNKAAMQAYARAAVLAERASGPNAALVEALKGALAVINDYLAYTHNGDPWTEDARTMGEMDINDYECDGRLEAARSALAAVGVEL